MRIRIVGTALLIAAAACTSRGDAAPKRVTAAAAQPTAPSTSSVDSVDALSAAGLARAADALARGGSTGRTIGARSTLKYVESRRTRNGSPEIHDYWTDVTFVQAGRATLLAGGRVSGSHAEANGEHRGGTLRGATSRVIGPGDFIMIPAGVPHEYDIAAGDSLRYLTIKVR